MKNRYYVVLKGCTPGIYSTWWECFNQVKKYKGAIWKSFKNLEDANNYYRYGLEDYFVNGSLEGSFKQKVINAVVKVRKSLKEFLWHIKIMGQMGPIRFIKFAIKSNLKRLLVCDFELRICLVQTRKGFYKMFTFNGEKKKDNKILMGLLGLTEDDFVKRPNK